MKKIIYILVCLAVVVACKQKRKKITLPKAASETNIIIKNFDLSRYDSLGNSFYKSKSGEIAELKYTREFNYNELNDTCWIYEYLDSVVYVHDEEHTKPLKDFIDVNTYRNLPKCYYSLDKNYVYFINTYCHHQTRFVLQNANPKTFEVVYKNTWAKDDKQVYYRFEAIKNADPKTFKVIGVSGDSAQDKNHIYVDGEIVK